jgi:hypothetical protein
MYTYADLSQIPRETLDGPDEQRIKNRRNYERKMFEALRNQRDSHKKESGATQNTFEEYLVNRDWMEKW